MKRISYLMAVAGALFVASGLMLLATSAVYAQEGDADVPYLAEYYEAWVHSPHNDVEAEAFNHWNEDGVVAVRLRAVSLDAGLPRLSWRGWLGKSVWSMRTRRWARRSRATPAMRQPPRR
ncbi:MAG: hypothetical protein HND48_03880 [Chloroflexi bacterium]|nr:hypothetical protein [Chloroflexota bacterium]